MRIEFEKSSKPDAPDREQSLNLDDLLRRVTKRNIHHEIETGPPIGREAR